MFALRSPTTKKKRFRERRRRTFRALLCTDESSATAIQGVSFFRLLSSVASGNRYDTYEILAIINANEKISIRLDYLDNINDKSLQKCK